MLQSDYYTTGKLYPKIDAYVKSKNPSQQNPVTGSWYYFGTTAQFKNCRNFIKFLSQKYPDQQFKAKKQEV